MENMVCEVTVISSRPQWVKVLNQNIKTTLASSSAVIVLYEIFITSRRWHQWKVSLTIITVTGEFSKRFVNALAHDKDHHPDVISPNMSPQITHSQISSAGARVHMNPSNTTETMGHWNGSHGIGCQVTNHFRD